MLAIVIPYYKINFFEATLTSLANQTDKRFKVYIGDDNGENPKKILSKYEGKFDYQYTRFATNLGSESLVEQWNRCIALSNDEPWLMLLGDDDVLANNTVALFYKNLEFLNHENCNVLRFASQVIDENDKVLSKPYFHPVIQEATVAYYEKITGKSRSSLSEYIFKRSAYEMYSFKNFPLAWHSDDLAWLEFSNFSNLRTVNAAIQKIRVSSLSISGNQSNARKKHKASFSFYLLLITKYLSYFSRPQQKLLLINVANLSLANKNKTYFLKIFYLFIKKMFILEGIKYSIKYSIK